MLAVMSGERSGSIELVEEICAAGPRRTGTDAERRAAAALAERLRRGGRTAAVEPIYVHPQWAAIHLAHCLLAIAGSLVAVAEPAIGFALVLLATASLYLDLSGRVLLLRTLFFRRASQNLISPPLPEALEDEPATERVILCAHLDAPRTGAVHNGWATRSFAALNRLLFFPTSPEAIVFWSMALLLPALGLRMAGIEGSAVSVAQLPQTLLLITAAFLLGEAALSPTSPGANDNASGVAAVVAALERISAERPARLEVHALLTGAGESTREGMRSFLRTHRKRLDRTRTRFIEIDSAGRGDPRWVLRQTAAITERPDPVLRDLAEALADGEPSRQPLRLAPFGDSGLAASYGYPSLMLTAREGEEFVPVGHHTPADTTASVDADSIDALARFAAEIVVLLDRDIGRRSAASATEAEREPAA